MGERAEMDVLWTPELVAEIIRELGYKAVITEDDEHDVWIESRSAGVPWRVAMLGSSPLFVGASLGIGIWVDDPYVWANTWNREKHAKAVVIVDPETDEIEQACDGTFLVVVTERITFHTGLTRAFFTATLEAWIDTVETIAMRDDVEVAVVPA